MTTYNPNGVTDAFYESAEDFLQDALIKKARDAGNQEIADYWNVAQHRHGANWFGLPTGADCSATATVALVRAGWPDGLTRIMENLGSIAPDIAKPFDLKRRLVWREQGDELDIHRVYAGQLDRAWRGNHRQVNRSVRHVTLGCDILCSGGCGSATLFWRGAAIVQLVDLLQEYGYVVSVIAGFKGITLGLEPVYCRIIVKQPDQPVSLADLAACTALPAFFRAIAHRWIPVHAKKAGCRTGIRVDGVPADMADYLASANIHDRQSASDWIIQTVNTINATESIEVDHD